MTNQERQWTNPSVLALAQGADPIGVIQARIRQTVVEATEQGWKGPPYDPFHLAELLKVGVRPNDDILDARTVPDSQGLRIEFNPNRLHGRIRFSLAHEIVHTLFPDCAETIRNRVRSDEKGADEWQLELLCNIGAAEILMPSGYTDLEIEDIDIDNLLVLRSEFEVSTEALLIRIAKLTSRPCAVFTAARLGKKGDVPDFRIDYSVPSRSWRFRISPGFRVESSSVLAECTAVGFTAKRTERWGRELPIFDVECVGIPPFPGDTFPRIAGVLKSRQKTQLEGLQIVHLFGDAREPRGTGKRIIAHVVNDTTPSWGGGFALEVRKRWFFIQEEFQGWVKHDMKNLVLGNVHCAQIDEELSIVHMVAQQGYGQSTKPRIRYAALCDALDQLQEIALEQGASVHMPRIGSGQAGGNWELIRELIDERLVRREIPVFIYSLPDSIPVMVQGMLNL